MKSGVIVLIIIVSILFLSVSFVSAGLLDNIENWFKDFFIGKGVTGRATDCGPNNQSSCTTESNCTTANGYWCSGVCQSTQCSVSSSCTDSDGVNYYSKGTVTWLFSNGSRQVFSDYCDSSTRLSEQTCTGNTPTQEYYTCGNSCSDGICITGTACGPNNVSACETQSNCTTAGGNWCDNGKCQSSACVSNQTNVTCTDTDSGNDIYIKGTVTLKFSNGSSELFPDFCLDSTRVQQHYCSGQSQSAAVSSCPNGCSNGACLQGTACGPNNVSACVTEGNCTTAKGYWCSSKCQSTACSNATTVSTTPITTTPSTPTTTTSSSGSGGGGTGGGGGGGYVGGYYVPSPDSKYKSEQESKFIDERGREVKIKTKTETKNGRTEIEETRSFIDKNGNKVEIKTEIEIESSEEGTEVKRKIKTKDGSEIIFRTKTEVEDGKERVTESVNVKGAEFITKLPIEEKFEEGETKLKAKLSTGVVQEIVASPDEALQTALNELGSTNNFKFELNEFGSGDQVKAVFLASAEKPGRFLGIFNIQINLETLVDTETGEIIETKRPWWSFLITGEDKATVCHVSDDGNKVTIEIAVSAVKAHLSHGDSIGECAIANEAVVNKKKPNKTETNKTLTNNTNQTAIAKNQTT